MLTPLFIDLDGTLVDSEPLHWVAWCEALRPIGIEFAWEEYEANAIGRTDTEILATLIARRADDLHAFDVQTLLREKRERFVSIARTRAVAPQTIDILRAVTHWDLALVTSSTRIEAAALLERDDLLRCFKTVISLDDVRNPKPHPEPYLLAKHRLRVGHGVAFEDSAAGLTSARAAGLDVIAVSSPAEFCSVMRRDFLARFSERGAE